MLIRDSISPSAMYCRKRLQISSGVLAGISISLPIFDAEGSHRLDNDAEQHRIWHNQMSVSADRSRYEAASIDVPDSAEFLEVEDCSLIAGRLGLQRFRRRPTPGVGYIAAKRFDKHTSAERSR